MSNCKDFPVCEKIVQKDFKTICWRHKKFGEYIHIKLKNCYTRIENLNLLSQTIFL